MAGPVKLFIVDDHYMVIEGIHSLLRNEAQVEWMGHAMNARSCLAFLHSQQPDVLLMDINLPDISGIELCRQVKEKYPNVFIIGLSTFNQQSFIRKMMDNGASGYILKNADRDELLLAIGLVMRGRTYLSEEAAAIAMKKVPDDTPVISRREKEVLELIAEGFTNQEIADKLYVGITTVNTHRKNLLAKFDVPNVAALVKKAMMLHIISGG